jgi:hypothetical protein
LELYSEASQPVLGPRGPHLLVSRKFPTGRGGFRRSDSSAFLRRKRHQRLLVVIAGKPENHAGYVVLCGRRQSAGCLKRLLKQSGHRVRIALPSTKTIRTGTAEGLPLTRRPYVINSGTAIGRACDGPDPGPPARCPTEPVTPAPGPGRARSPSGTHSPRSDRSPNWSGSSRNPRI